MLQLRIAKSQTVPPVLPDPARADIEVWHDLDGTVCGFGHIVDGQHWIHMPNVASFCFHSTQDEVLAVALPEVDENLIADAFHRSVVPLALQTRGQEVLHASAVKMPCGVVALCAVSHTGKSTLAYGLGQRGYPLWADDAVSFELRNDRIEARPLAFRMHLRPQSASHFGCDWDDDISGWEHVTPPELLPVPLAAVCVLERDEHVPIVQMTRLASAQAFAGVLAHAYCFSLQDMHHKRRMMEHYLELTSRVPVFEVRFQTGFEKLGTVLDEMERCLNALPTNASRRVLLQTVNKRVD